jgi:predicted secreted protein
MKHSSESARTIRLAMVPLWLSLLCLSNQQQPQHSYVVVTPQLEGAEEKATVQLDKSQTLLVVLPWQATGYSWKVSEYDKAFLNRKQLDRYGYRELVNRGIVKKSNQSHGEPGLIEKRVFEFIPLSFGTTHVELQYIRGFEKQPSPAKKLFLSITVSDRTTNGR